MSINMQDIGYKITLTFEPNTALPEPKAMLQPLGKLPSAQF